MKESWKDIPGYDGKYQADTEGNIRRVYPSGKTRLLRPYHKHMSGSQRMIVKPVSYTHLTLPTILLV